MDNRPIGMFDSGVGGISIMKEVRRLLPNEDITYYSDSAYCPYGVKPVEAIEQRACAISELLLSLGSKALVVACNTASLVALDTLRQRYEVPIVGIEPAVKPATLATKNRRVGVLATSVSLAGDRFAQLVARFASDVQVFTQPAPGLVELVEAGKVEGLEVEGLLQSYLGPLLGQGVDTIVLGCTHYPFLRPTIERLVGSGVLIIDTGEPVARQTARLLERRGLAAGTDRLGRERFLTSGRSDSVEPVVRRLWGGDGTRVAHMEAACPP